MRSQHGLRGPAFPSFVTPPMPALYRLSVVKADTAKTRLAGKMYLSHQGQRQRMRYLRQRCKPVFDMAAGPLAAALPTIALIDELTVLVRDEPHPEYGLLHLISAALDACEGTGATWYWRGLCPVEHGQRRAAHVEEPTARPTRRRPRHVGQQIGVDRCQHARLLHVWP